MSREIVLDIETRGELQDFDNLKVTVVSVYEYEHDTYRSFEEHELLHLWPLLEKCERIIGYNSEHFDLPILNHYYTGDLLKFGQLDILKVIKESTGKRFKLNDIAKATLQIEKSADGLQAQKWWAEGKVEEIKRYCEQDVKVTKEIYEFGRQNRQLFYKTLKGEILPFAVDFSTPKISTATNQNINLTLPF